MNNRHVSPWLSVLLLAALSSPLAAQGPGGSPEVPARGGFSLELSVADAGIDWFAENRLALGVRPRWCPRNRWNGRVCFWIDFCRIPRPWPDLTPGDVVPGVPFGELETGPGWMVAPTLEWALRPAGRWRPAVYLGAGVSLVESNTTDLGERGTYTIASSASPLLTYGVNFAYDLSPRTTLRFQLGAATTFMDGVEVTGVQGRGVELGLVQGGGPVLATAPGGNVTTAMVGVSFAYRFGGCQ